MTEIKIFSGLQLANSDDGYGSVIKFYLNKLFTEKEKDTLLHAEDILNKEPCSILIAARAIFHKGNSDIIIWKSMCDLKKERNELEIIYVFLSGNPSEDEWRKYKTEFLAKNNVVHMNGDIVPITNNCIVDFIDFIYVCIRHIMNQRRASTVSASPIGS